MASTVWRGYISFGLISIPVRLFRAARAERVSFRRLYRAAGSASGRISRENGEEDRSTEAVVEPIGKRRAMVDTAPTLAAVQQASVLTGATEVLPESSVVKGYEVEKGRYIVVEPEELKSITPKTATTMQIEEFVKLAEVDPVYFETSYHVVPEEVGKKAYALLYRSLKATGLVAVAQFAMHSRDHVVIVRPASKGLLAHTMFFNSEVHAEQEYAADIESISQKEFDLAQTLIHSLAGSFEPGKYHDAYREKLEALIAAKAADQPVPTLETPRASRIADMTEALQKSLAALKKPVKSETQPVQALKTSSGQRKKRVS